MGVGSPERELERFERRLSGMTFGTRRNVSPTRDAVGENGGLAFVAETSDAICTRAAIGQKERLGAAVAVYVRCCRVERSATWISSAGGCE